MLTNIFFKLVSILVLLIKLVQGEDSSYDSLISSQCKAKCLSLYPWNFGFDTDNTDNAIEKSLFHGEDIIRRKRDELSSTSLWASFLPNSAANKKIDQLANKTKKKKLRHFDTKPLNTNNNNQHHFNVKWHKVMELCSKNANCLQCSLPCEIPTNLLSNCKYLCKNRHPLCIESCNLLTKLSKEKYGTCPNIFQANINPLIIQTLTSGPEKCNNYTKSLELAQSAALLTNTEQKVVESAKPVFNTCSKDSDCADIGKCCMLNPACPQHGNVCQRPQINNANMPSIPFNLSIVERKKGKTIILSWDCNYNKNKPTMFVVEGRWSLNSPTSSSSVNDNYMTKWGYLAQTVNNNWIILRSINRGRWYKFRVAAISKSGTYGYSQATELFILSSPPKPPSQPQNLTVSKLYPSSTDQDKVDADVSWIPSKRSDLPITNYKITWAMISDKQSSNDDETLWQNKMANHGGQDLIDAQNLNKYTIHNLYKDSIYSVEITAQSEHEQKMLVSSSMRITLDTTFRSIDGNKDNLESYSLQLKADKPNIPNEDNNNNNNHNDYDDEDEDLDMKHNTRNSLVEQQQPVVAALAVVKRPIIKNLFVQTPYFQNGLVKAKLSWQVENGQTDNKNSQIEASINAKTVIDQPMFTITWFAIKCTKSETVTLPQRQLPTPITATTINTHFEIYELKYNCDYVVNVRLAISNHQSDTLSSSIQRPMPPQIASTQFKVPSCTQINVVGRIQPMCYKDSIESVPFNKNVYSIFSSSTSSITTITDSQTTTKTTTSIPFVQLPRVYNIRYKIVGRSSHQNLYSVEFTWSIPSSLLYSRNLFNAYQISVVPKAIPGFGLSYQDKTENKEVDSNGEYVGSVSAVLDKEHNSFIVRQLKTSIRYIFQIQTINKDEQFYGPPNSLEFMIENEDYQSTFNDDNNSSEQQRLLQIKIKNHMKSHESEVTPLSSSSAQPNYLNNLSPKSFSFSSLLIKSVFVILFNYYFLNYEIYRT